jgi:hypothetical protein
VANAEYLLTKGRFCAWASVCGLVTAAVVVAVLSAQSTSDQALYPPPPSGNPLAVVKVHKAAAADLAAGSFVADVSLTMFRPARGPEVTNSSTGHRIALSWFHPRQLREGH